MAGADVPTPSLELSLVPRIGLAARRAGLPAIRRLTVDNPGTTPLDDVTVTIACEPEIAAPVTLAIRRIAAGGTWHEDAIPLEPSEALLIGTRSRTSVEVRVTLVAAGNVHIGRQQTVVLLPPDEWPGLGAPAELLAAHVRPWTAAVGTCLGKIDARTTPGAALAAAHAALATRSLEPAGPVPDMLANGCRLPAPSSLLAGGAADPLQRAVLLAAMLERGGGRPLLVLHRDKTLVGVWQGDAGFQAAAVHDGLVVKKRADLALALLIDASETDYGRARESARHVVADLDGFECAIDVGAARQAGVEPLPSPDDEPAPPRTSTGMPAARRTATAASAHAARSVAATGPRTRLEVWKQRLLDSTLRNRLLDHRATQSSIPLLAADLAELEDALASDRAFRIVAAAEGKKPLDVHTDVSLRDHLREELARRHLCAATSARELDGRLVKIYRDSRTAAEEGGANVLYLALGFLHWYEADDSDVRRRAPLLLLPLELTRPSVAAGFEVRLSGEEPRVNVTLLQKLATDFGLDVGGLDVLAEDDAGIDVHDLLQRVRELVLRFDRWDVVDDAVLGLFSFTKFLMWRDLEEHTDVLARNAVVRHLLEHPEQRFEGHETFLAADQLDEERSPDVTFCPLDADSSQLAAVFAAAAGNTFVLQGPPGTGKSQTIANLIAQTLADGKRVLFVSEKMAALEVVRARLAAVGLAPFCLELHSTRARKREVLRQLEEALVVGHQSPPDGWSHRARQLDEARAELNEIADLLHRPRPVGCSFFHGIGQAIAHRDALQPRLEIADHHAVERDRLERMRAMAARLGAAATAIGSPASHPLAAARRLEWQAGLERVVTQEASALIEDAARLGDAGAALAAALGIALPSASRRQRELLGRLAAARSRNAAPSPVLLTADRWLTMRQALLELIANGRSRDRLRDELSATWRDDVLAEDLEGLRVALARSRATLFPWSWWRRRGVTRTLRPHRRDGALPRPAALADELQRLTAWRDAERAVGASRAALAEVLDGTPQDWAQLESWVQWLDEVRTIVAELGHHGVDVDVQRLVVSPRETALREEIAAALRTLGDSEDDVRRALSALATALDLDPRQLVADDDPDETGRLTAAARGWVEHTGELRAWFEWNRARRDALEGDLAPLVAAIEREGLTGSQVPAAFEAAFWHGWVEATEQTEPLLRSFTGGHQQLRVERFRELDLAMLTLAKEAVFARLAARLPEGDAAATSEVGVLQRQLKKARGHWPVRKLLQRLPNLLPRLKPCLLMSPLSVAQHLDVDLEPFDLVVFDEASQIPVQDAIGAIGRSRHVVVVGDSKQLPPTTFFDRVDDEDDADDDEMIEELESILDECVAAQLPSRTLDWHYRSRHESLIAFSNWHYYDNRLLTFPSAVDREDGLGVSWRPVPDGVYDRSHSRTNRAEAEAVIAEIRSRAAGNEPRSLGVVTFSAAQQHLVEDLLDAARREDSALDAWLAREDREPLFVKNLENVQGDERDVVMFSVGYGPDDQGRVHMNFGPLNKPGGERRLNVAVTRARQQVLVFSTLRADQIDLAKVGTQAVGVRHLKTFLEYAARGPAALGEATTPDTGADWESPFEQDVHRALVERGWEVHCQVGCSGYRVDLAVVHPQAKGRYLLGVECDGATYHRAKTARDRDRLRQSVLERLGWHLERVWSTDWFHDRAGQAERLHRAAEARLRAEPQPLDRSDAAEARPEPRVDVADEAPNHESETTAAAEPESATPAAGDDAGHDDGTSTLPAYDVTTLPPANGDAFWEARSDETLTRQIEQVVRREAPISVEMLLRRLKGAWSLERITARARQRVDELAARAAVRVEEIGGRRFLWPAQGTEAAPSFRVPGPTDPGRDSSDIHPLEIAAAAEHLLRGSIGLAEDDLVRETAHLLGFARVGRRVEEDVRRGVALLIERGAAERHGEQVVLPRADRPAES